MTHLMQNLQVVLLYKEAEAFDARFAPLAKIEKPLTRALKEFGPWKSLHGHSSPNTIGFASASRHITLQRFDAKMSMAGFVDLMANPLLVNGKPELSWSIVEHERAILIEVGAGAVPGFAAALMQAGLQNTLKCL